MWELYQKTPLTDILLPDVQMRKAPDIKKPGREAKAREERELARVEREGAELDAELERLKSELQQMRDLWLSLICQGRIQYVPEGRCQPPHSRESFRDVTESSGHGALSFIETYMMDFSESYKDKDEPFDNLEDDLPLGFDGACANIDNILVDTGFWFNLNEANNC